MGRITETVAASDSCRKPARTLRHPCFRALFILGSTDTGEEHFGIAKLSKIAHTHGIQLANQMIAFVLHYAGVKSIPVRSIGSP